MSTQVITIDTTEMTPHNDVNLLSFRLCWLVDDGLVLKNEPFLTKASTITELLSRDKARTWEIFATADYGLQFEARSPSHLLIIDVDVNGTISVTHVDLKHVTDSTRRLPANAKLTLESLLS